jgi:hypothetical protein
MIKELKMDIFVEQIVKKVPDAKDNAKKVALIAGTIVLAGLLLVFLMGLFPFNIVLFFGAIYGCYYLFTGLDCEYEYIITNGDLDIDKIIAKRKRKRLISVKISTFEDFGKYNANSKPADGVTTVLAGENSGEGDYYADFKHPTLGNVRLIFTPNEKTITGMKPYFSRIILTKI